MRLQGDSNDIATMYDIVYKCFHRLDMTEHMKTKAELIAQQVRLYLSAFVFDSFLMLDCVRVTNFILLLLLSPPLLPLPLFLPPPFSSSSYCYSYCYHM